MVYDEKRNQSNLISLVSFPNYYKKKDPRTAESVRIFEGVGTPTISLHPKNQSIYSLLWLEDKLPYSKITPEVISHEERRRRVFKQMTRVGPSKKNIWKERFYYQSHNKKRDNLGHDFAYQGLIHFLVRRNIWEKSSCRASKLLLEER